MLLGICQHGEVELDLFAEDQSNHNDDGQDESNNKRLEVTAIMDALNQKYGQNNHQ